jgi:hypothetical protein
MKLKKLLEGNFLGEKKVVGMLKNAHLYAWIGDFEQASSIINEVEHSNEKIAIVLKPEIDKKVKEYKENWLATHDSEQKHIKGKNKLIPPETSILYKKNISSVLHWKYSVTKASTLMGLVQLEIRAFNPEGSQPLKNFTLDNLSIEGWYVKTLEESDQKGNHTLQSVYLKQSNSEEEILLSIDRWGLVSGIAIGLEDETEIILGHIYSILCLLDERVWNQHG